MSSQQRIPNLPEAEWDDDARSLVESSWSNLPSKGHDFFKTAVRHRELFRAWNEFGRVIFNGVLSPRDREVVVLRAAWLAQCKFEWGHHEPLAISLGITQEEIEGITEGPSSPKCNSADVVLISAVDELERDHRISDTTWSMLRGRYTDEQLIELPMLVGEYLLVAYFLNTMNISPASNLPPLPTAPAPA